MALAAAKTLGVDADALYPQLLDKSKASSTSCARPTRSGRRLSSAIAGVGFLREESACTRRAPWRLTSSATPAPTIADWPASSSSWSACSVGVTAETFVKDPFGRVLNVVRSKPERPGRDVFLTIDHTIQANAESVLGSTVSQWRAARATAVVLDAQSGGILAMAVAPAFDANAYARTPVDRHRNVAVTDTFEPGSTFKLVTVAGRSRRSRQRKLAVPRCLRDPRRRPFRARRGASGAETMTVAQILARSSNVGAISLAQLLGPQRLGRWIERFEFGKPTGIDYPGDPRHRAAGGRSGSTIGNVPIGQGIGVTAVQMAAAYAAVANGGMWTAPHLVDHVSGGGGVKPERRRVADLADQVLRMLENVVLEDRHAAAVPGYLIAGKTGTAAKPDPVTAATRNELRRLVHRHRASQPAALRDPRLRTSRGEPSGAASSPHRRSSASQTSCSST